MFGAVVAVVYWQQLSRLWLLAAAIAINAIFALLRVYRPCASRYERGRELADSGG
jgi:hypothetical protein